jgi:hypothetical protein
LDRVGEEADSTGANRTGQRHDMHDMRGTPPDITTLQQAPTHHGRT